MSVEPNVPASKLHELIGRAISDQEFADRVVNRETRADALREMEIDPTPDVLDEIEHAVHHLRYLWETFREQKFAS